MERRVFLKSAAGLGTGVLGAARAQPPQGSQSVSPAKPGGRLKQSVTLMCFGGCMEFEETAKLAASLGFKGYDYLQSKDWPTIKKYGLVPSLSCGAITPFVPRCAQATTAAGGAAAAPGGRGGRGPAPLGGVQTGPNVGRGGPTTPAQMEIAEKEHHDEQEKLLTGAIDEAALSGAPNIILFAGYRKAGGMSDTEAADNSVTFLNRIKAHAEQKGVNICLELLNSRVNHRGYFFDHMDWGVDVVKRVDSPRVGILYDIYHAQVDDGDIVRTIRNNIRWIKHVHTAGNPGRKQLDDDQELNWRFVARALAELNYDGFVGHEYIPTQGADPAACLKQAFEIFNV